MHAIPTPRLNLRPMNLEDAPFILELLNEPAFIANIADKGVRDLEGARGYLRNGPMASYTRHGFGLYAVDLRESGETLGICGLIRREGLEDPDVGFAFLERHWHRGYAQEAARACLEHGWQDLHLSRIVAITAPGNASSGRVLECIGMRFSGMIDLPAFGGENRLYVIEHEDPPPIGREDARVVHLRGEGALMLRAALRAGMMEEEWLAFVAEQEGPVRAFLEHPPKREDWVDKDLLGTLIERIEQSAYARLGRVPAILSAEGHCHHHGAWFTDPDTLTQHLGDLWSLYTVGGRVATERLGPRRMKACAWVTDLSDYYLRTFLPAWLVRAMELAGAEGVQVAYLPPGQADSFKHCYLVEWA